MVSNFILFLLTSNGIYNITQNQFDCKISKNAKSPTDTGENRQYDFSSVGCYNLREGEFPRARVIII